ncbi:hypothetical protein [Paractinoplanes durhamensis]|uniref:hypothetical protein n=1 Tax=Paractinoplanes durhamensis TaxID=113563 RepID=UPI0019425D9B|nr:hypothetical protein [Actinoplanes durhamensis]
MNYDVRRSVRIRDQRLDSVRRWRFDLLEAVHAERRGWSFDWYGELVSSPVFYLAHTDGRVGVRAGGPFLEVWTSFDHLIESHALMDELAGWDPVTPSSLETWVPTRPDDDQLTELLAPLSPVPEASGPCDRWWRSDDLAVRQFHAWTDTRPRPIGTMIWSRR